MVNANNNAPVVNNNAPVANNPVVNAPVANNNAPVKKQKRGKAKNNKLNLLIGSTSRFTAQLVGLQIVSGNMLALLCSMIQTSAGIAIVLYPQASLQAEKLPGQWRLAGLIALEGGAIILAMIFATIIERLTIRNLKDIHKASKAIRKLEDEYEEKLEKGDIKDTKEDIKAAKKALKRRKKHHVTKQITGIAVAVVASAISIALGSLLWDIIFSSKGVKLEGLSHYITLVAPFLIAVIIPLTFSDSELSKEDIEEAVKESIDNLTVLETAVQNERAAFQMDVILNSILEMRNDPEKQRQLRTTVQETMLTSIGNNITRLIALPNPQTVEALPSPKEQTAIDADYKSEPLTPAPIPAIAVQTPVVLGTLKIAPKSLPAINTISLTRVTSLPAPDDQDDSASQIELESEFERELFNSLIQADQADLVEALFQLYNQDAPTKDAISLLSEAYPDSAAQFTPECVGRVWRKIVHEANTEPLTASRPVVRVAREFPVLDDQDDSQDDYEGHYPFDVSKPNPDAVNADKGILEALGINTKEDFLKLLAQFKDTPDTTNNSAQIEQSTPAQKSPKTAQRRKRQLTGEQGKPRSVMTPAKMRKLEQILSTDPTISDRALGAQLKVSANTAKKYREALQTEQS